jgi:hypothetical protein
MATKRCLYISTFGPGSAPTHNAAEAIYNTLVAPVFRIDFPEFEIIRYHAESVRGSISERVLNDVLTADLVIADLTELTSNGFYELGVRHSTGLPTVLLAQVGHPLPFDHKDFRFVNYLNKGSDDLGADPDAGTAPSAQADEARLAAMDAAPARDPPPT